MRFSSLAAGSSTSSERCSRRSASVSSRCSRRPTCPSGSCDGEVVLHRPVDVLDGPAREGRDEAAEVLHDVVGPLGEAGEPRLLAERDDEARLAEEELRLPGRPEPRSGMAHEGEPEPALLGQDPLTLRVRVVGEAVSLSPQAHVVHRERRRDLGKRRLRERLGGDAGELGEQPEERRAARLRHREEEDPPILEDDGAPAHVVRERQLGPLRDGGRRPVHLDVLGHIRLSHGR